jgi:hypothetical protein
MLCTVIWHFVSDSSSSVKNKKFGRPLKINMKKVEGDTEDDELIDM